MLCYNSAATDYPGSIILKTLFRNFRRNFRERFYAILRILSVFYMCFYQIKKITWNWHHNTTPIIKLRPSTFDVATKLITEDNKIIYLKEQGKDALQGYTAAYYFSLKKKKSRACPRSTLNYLAWSMLRSSIIKQSEVSCTVCVLVAKEPHNNAKLYHEIFTCNRNE